MARFWQPRDAARLGPNAILRAMTRRSLLRGRDFRLVAGAVGLSALGDWVAIVALGLHVKDMTDSGFAVAGLWVCLFGPSVAVAGHAGLLVDRIEATRLLAAVSLLGALVAAVLGFTTGTAAVLALTALLGLVFAILQPAEFALVPQLAGNRIQEANAHVETARYVGFGLGPLLGGLLFLAGGLELAMLVDAATFAAVAGAALALRVRRDPRTLEEAERTPRARDGVAFLFGDRVLSLAMMVAFSSLLFMSAVWVGELFFIEDVLGRGDVAYGLMLSIWTVGMALGALLLSPRVAAGAVAATGLPAVAVQGMGLALPALWLSFAFFLACSFVGGLAHGAEERHVPEPHPRPRSRPPARARVRRLQRDPELGRAGRLRRRRPAGDGDRPARHAGLRRRPLRARRARWPAGPAAHVQGMGPDRPDRSAGRRRGRELRATRAGAAGARGGRGRLSYCTVPNAPAKKTSGSLTGEIRRSSTRPTTIQWSPAGMLGDDLTLEGGEGVREQRYAAASELPVEAGESVRAGRGRAYREPLVLPPQHVYAEAPRPPHARPRERAAGRAERHQGRLERDGRERVHDQPGGLAVRRRRDEGDAGREPAECVAERARVRRRRGWAGAASAISVERRLFAESDVAEVVVGAVGAERVHEGAGLDVAVRARERAAVDVAGAAREGERAVHDAGGRLVDERLGRLGLGEQRAELLGAAVGRRVGGAVVVDQRSRRATGRRARPRGRRRCRPPACAGAHRR